MKTVAELLAYARALTASGHEERGPHTYACLAVEALCDAIEQMRPATSAPRELLDMARRNNEKWRSLARRVLREREWITDEAMDDDMLRLAFEQWLSAQPDFLKLNYQVAADERERIAKLFYTGDPKAPITLGEAQRRIRESKP